MTRLSVNINKIATLRNARGGNNPDLVKSALDCERFGAEGITVHPRPDERHIRYQDVIQLKPVLQTEFNIEGYPDDRYLQLLQEIKPAQATLVPDPPGAITSQAGWNVIEHGTFLQRIIRQITESGIRVSIFIETDLEQIEAAAAIGTDRIELYTEPYASLYPKDKSGAVRPYVKAAELAQRLGLGVNAGHDLSLENLGFLKKQIPFLEEVSIGHALICDALYYGLENTIGMYKRQLKA